jgi:hypothetical protein
MSNELHWRQALAQEANDPNRDFPAVSAELVERLESLYPDRCPSLDASDREVWAAKGRAQVVAFLREISKRIPTMEN